MDWGYSRPYCVLWLAMSEEGVIYIWRELYGIDQDMPNVGSKEDAGEVAEKIKGIEKHDERNGYTYRMNLADPSIFSNIGASRSIGQIFRDHGVRWVPAWNAKGSRVNGWQEIVRLLAEGRLRIFRTCKNLIRTLPVLTPDDNNPEDIDTDMEDHAADALRYGVMRKRRPPTTETKSSHRIESEAEITDEGITFAPDF